MSPRTNEDKVVKRVSSICKCERCGRFRELFQYTKFETKIVDVVQDNGYSANPRYTTKREDLGEKRGLCEDCAVIVNSAAYDARYTASTPDVIGDPIK